jgi:hypothetical protein
MSATYINTLRAIAEQHRCAIETIDDFDLDAMDIRCIVREFPDVLTEAIAGFELGLADFYGTPEFNAMVHSLIRTKCKRYVMKDLLSEQSDMALEHA